MMKRAHFCASISSTTIFIITINLISSITTHASSLHHHNHHHQPPLTLKAGLRYTGNRARYSRSNQQVISESVQLVNFESTNNNYNNFILPSSSTPQIVKYPISRKQIPPKPVLYRINHRFAESNNHNHNNNNNNYNVANDDPDNFNTLNQLDNEDKNLLDKFYEEARSQDPFQGESLSSQELWDEMRDKELINLMDTLRDTSKQMNEPNGHGMSHSESGRDKKKLFDMLIPTSTIDRQRTNNHEWMVDDVLLEQAKQLNMRDELSNSTSNNTGTNLTNSTGTHTQEQANYSPSMKLLISYNPFKDTTANLISEESGHIFRELNNNNNNNTNVSTPSPVIDRIVGATVTNRLGHQTPSPQIVSKSPLDAIRLHNELFEDPPRDGKVRVRMYFHRAIHDDLKLYGTGPWKYWGHGWGVEYGYDPKLGGPKNYQQRGYTIERAYGRDFCKDPKNCRPADPNFFNHIKRPVVKQ